MHCGFPPLLYHMLCGGALTQEYVIRFHLFHHKAAAFPSHRLGPQGYDVTQLWCGTKSQGTGKLGRWQPHPWFDFRDWHDGKPSCYIVLRTNCSRCSKSVSNSDQNFVQAVAPSSCPSIYIWPSMQSGQENVQQEKKKKMLPTQTHPVHVEYLHRDAQLDPSRYLVVELSACLWSLPCKRE